MTVDRRVQDEESCVFKLSSNKLNTNKKGSRLNAGFLLKLKRARDRDRTRDPLLGKEVLHH